MRIIKIMKTHEEKRVRSIRSFFIDKIYLCFINFRKCSFLKYFNKKKGIEIGGPSIIFSKEIPIYQIIKSLDGCNFSNHTVWEGNIVEGDEYNYYKSRKGYQYICEASNLEVIPDEQYEFLISSHCLEHCANTLKTVNEWLRVLKRGGAILLILPDKDFTFDHKRSITTFDHLLKDFRNDIDEHDLSHLAEILDLHDLSLDIPAGTKEEFKRRSLANFENRCLHHHVFDLELLRALYCHVNVKIVKTAFIKPYHQVILGIKK